MLEIIYHNSWPFKIN